MACIALLPVSRRGSAFPFWKAEPLHFQGAQQHLEEYRFWRHHTQDILPTAAPTIHWRRCPIVKLYLFLNIGSIVKYGTHEFDRKRIHLVYNEVYANLRVSSPELNQGRTQEIES
ncbi:hypothetical protein DC20_16015 [Rufibacter tibetensis]|uniref:Uncharacterized protein n=1 Tax=Rufibacter tibetensis TaxID=512763 RepID=A0A0P0D070_9BACT|nr:hypothetical protein DC20_16015 [Rufibacter tibetensis]